MKKIIALCVLLIMIAGAAHADTEYDYVAACNSGEKVSCVLNDEGGYNCTLYDANGDAMFSFKSGPKHVVYTNGTIIINDGDGGYFYVHDYNKQLLLKCLAVETGNGAPFAFESVDGLWGTFDAEGEIIVPAAFESLDALNAPAQTFAEEHGLRIFQSAAGRMGLMNADGSVILPADYECITPPKVWQDGAVRIGLCKNGLWGWYGTDGQSACVFLHEPEQMFGGFILATLSEPGSESIELCRADGTCAYRFDDAVKFSDTRLAVRTGNTSELLDENLNVIFETPYQMEALFGNRIRVTDGNFRYGLINAEDGSVAAEVIYDELSDMYGGHALAQSGSAASVIDENGNVLYTQPKADPDSNDQGAVLENGYIVLMTRSGSEDHPYQYTVLSPDLKTVFTFEGTWMNEYKNGAIAYYDESADEDVMLDTATGRELLRAPQIDLSGGTTHARVRLADDKWTLYSTDGTRFLNGEYSDVGDTDSHGLICVKPVGSENYIFIDAQENIVLHGGWNWAYGFDENGYGIADNERYIDLNGAAVAPYIETPDVWY